MLLLGYTEMSGQSCHHTQAVVQGYILVCGATIARFLLMPVTSDATEGHSNTQCLGHHLRPALYLRVMQ